MDPTEFLRRMMALCELYPFSVTSFNRTAKRNTMVGGVSNSHHMKWKAMDCVLDDRTHAPEFIATVRTKGLQVVDEGDHIHVEVP